MRAQIAHNLFIMTITPDKIPKKCRLTLQYLYCELEFLTDKKRKQRLEKEILKMKNMFFISENYSEYGNDQVISLFFSKTDSPKKEQIFSKKENKK